MLNFIGNQRNTNVKIVPFLSIIRKIILISSSFDKYMEKWILSNIIAGLKIVLLRGQIDSNCFQNLTQSNILHLTTKMFTKYSIKGIRIFIKILFSNAQNKNLLVYE